MYERYCTQVYTQVNRIILGAYLFNSLYTAITIDTPLEAIGSNGWFSCSSHSSSVVHIVSFQVALQRMWGRMHGASRAV